MAPLRGELFSGKQFGERRGRAGISLGAACVRAFGLQHVIDLVDPGYMTFWGREGLMSHDAVIRSIDLMTRHVIPAIKAYRPAGRCRRHSGMAER